MSSVPDVMLIEAALRAVLSALSVVPLVIAIVLKSWSAPRPPASMSDMLPPSNVTVASPEVNASTPYQSPPTLMFAAPEHVSVPTSISPLTSIVPVETVMVSLFVIFSATFSVFAP